MACRVIHSFGSGICEALPVQLVNDTFFLHERGKRLGYYTGRFQTFDLSNGLTNPPSLVVCLCLGSTGPLYAGYMLAGGYSWRLFFYVEFAFAMGLLVLAFFFVAETAYTRPPSTVDAPTALGSDKELATDHFEDRVSPPQRRPYLSTLKPWSSINRESEFFMMMIRSFSYYLVPSVFWVVTTYGKVKFTHRFGLSLKRTQESILDLEL